MRILHPAALLWFRLVGAGGIFAFGEYLVGPRPPDPTHLGMSLLVAVGAFTASALARNGSVVGSMLAAFALTAVVCVALFLGLLAATFATYYGWVLALVLLMLICLATGVAAVVLWVGSPRTWELSRAQRQGRLEQPVLPNAQVRVHDHGMDADR